MRLDYQIFSSLFRLTLGGFFLFLTATCFGQNFEENLPVKLQVNVPVSGSLASSETQIFALRLDKNHIAALNLRRQGFRARMEIKDAKNGQNVLSAEINRGFFASDQILLTAAEESREFLIRVVAYDKKIAAADKFTLTITELKKIEARDFQSIDGQNALLEGIRFFNEAKSGAKEKALISFKKALNFARKSGNLQLELDVLTWLQITNIHTSDLTESIEFGNAALMLARRMKNAYAEIVIKNGLGYALTDAGEARRGIAVLDEILPLTRAFGDRSLEADILNNLSNGYQKLDDYTKSLELSEQAVQSAENVGNPLDQIESLRIMSRVYYRRSEFSKAIEILNKALQLVQKQDAEFSKDGIYNDLAGNFIALGQLQKALDFLQAAVEEIRRTGTSRYGEAANLSAIAKLYRQLGQDARAVEYSRQAARIFGEYNDNEAIVRQLTETAGLYLALKNFPKAKIAFQDALKISEKYNFNVEIGTIYFFLGKTEEFLGNSPAALENFLKSAQIRSSLKLKQPEAVALDAAAKVYIQLGDFSSAEISAAQSLEKSRATGDRVIESNALYNLARVRRSQKSLNEALKLIDDSLKIVESLRAELINRESRTAFLATVRDKYDFYISLLIELQNQPGNENYGAQAFAASERARARGLLDLLAESHTDVSAGINPGLKARERDLEAKISALQTQFIRLKSSEKPDEKRLGELQENIKRADDEREKLESEIKRTNPRYAALKYSTTIDLKQTQAMLDEKTVLLEYQVGANSSFLFVVGQSEFQIFKLPGEKTLRGAVETLHRSISSPARTNLANYLVTGSELYQTLIAPIENLLKNKTKIIVAADGALNYLPFETLLKTNQTASFDKLPYLVRDFEIAYTPSASVLANLKNYDKAEKPQKTFLAFAAPDYATKPTDQTQFARQTARTTSGEDSDWKLADLRFAKTEAEKIAKLFPAGQATVFTGADATEQRVKQTDFLNRYRYLHFAVHGLIDEERPQFSSLVLSFPKNADEKSAVVEDGLLQTTEIFNLRLRADLVTLSACETGLGQELRGEGMIGLTRAFFYAGTPSVLVSLWKVDDASTAELMTLFYENLQKNDGRDKAAALRETQLKMIAEKRYAHPFYWSPFILQGKTTSDF